MELKREMPKEEEAKPAVYRKYDNHGKEDLFDLRFELFDWLKNKDLTYLQAYELLRCTRDAMFEADIEYHAKTKLKE